MQKTWKRCERLLRCGCTTYAAAGALFSAFCLAVLFFVPPKAADSVHRTEVFVVSEGKTIRETAEDLRERGFITSQTLFIVANYLFGGKILYGSYHFHEPHSVFLLARDLYYGNKDMPLRKVVVPEESDLYDLADLFEREFANFDRTTFEELAREHHGYLYPDTYLFSEDEADPEFLVDIMMKTFRQRTDSLFDSYDGPLSKDEIVALASVVELEAGLREDRKLIAGVLFNRLARDMRLQVDVSFRLINRKDTFDLNREDLVSDHPLNLYRNYGIPPIPIVNPSYESIEAVINPTESDYLYFVGDGRRTYFSETYEEHLEKKRIHVDSRK